MVKAFNPPKKIISRQLKKTNKSVQRASIRMPKKMHEEIVSILKRERKSSYYKGKWISQAIIDLFNIEEYIDLIDEEWIDRTNNIAVQVVLSEEAKIALNKMIAAVKERGIERNDLISATIRVAITNALIVQGYL